MNELYLLTKVQALGLFGFRKFRFSKDRKERRKGGLMLAGIIALGVILCATSFFYSMMMAYSFRAVGRMELLPAMMMAVVSVMVLFTTIYKVNGLLFGFKDYDLTMSLPVRPGIVVASRVLVLYLMNLAFAFVLMVPAGVVYAIETAPAWTFYLFFLLAFFLIPLVPIVLATILGSLVMKISSRFRRSNVLSLALSVIVCVAVVAVSMNPRIYENFGDIGAAMMNQVYGLYPLAQMYVDAVCGGNVLSFLGFAAVSLALFVLFCAALGRWFQQINSALSARYAGGSFKMTALRQSSPFQALFRKELRRYLSSSIYVLNTAIGLVLALVLSVALLFFDPGQIEQMMEMPGFSRVICQALPLAVGFLVGMSSPTGSSLSLEGKSLWILQSAPVPARMILAAKMAVGLVFSLPTVAVSGVLMAVALKPQPLDALFLFLTPAAFAVFSAVWGMVANLHFPNFNWTSEVTVVKQSVATMTAVFGSMILGMAPIGLIMAQPQNGLLILVCVTVLLWAAAALLAVYLNTRGGRILKALAG